MIGVDLLMQGLQVVKLNLKREITSLKMRRDLKIIYHLTDVYLVSIHAQERLSDALLNDMKHLRYNGQVKL